MDGPIGQAESREAKRAKAATRIAASARAKRAVLEAERLRSFALRAQERGKASFAGCLQQLVHGAEQEENQRATRHVIERIRARHGARSRALAHRRALIRGLLQHEEAERKHATAHVIALISARHRGRAAMAHAFAGLANGTSRAPARPSRRTPARNKTKKKSSENHGETKKEQDAAEGNATVAVREAAGGKRKRVSEGASDQPASAGCRVCVGAARGVPRMAGYAVKRRRENTSAGILSDGCEDDL